MNYSELVASISTFAQNYEADFVAAIPTFVKLTEQKAFNATQLPAVRKNQTATLTPTIKYLSLPSDYLAPFSFSVITPVTLEQHFLLDKDVSYIREAFPSPTVEGVPRYYAMFDADSYILGPTPDLAYGVELHYYAYPESIVTASTTWLGDNFDMVLLYGSLVEASIFMKEEADMIANYKAQFQDAMTLLKVLADGKNRRDAYRSGQVRVDVS